MAPTVNADALPPSHSERQRWRSALIAVLTFSAVVRWILVSQGGQYFFGDEHRYDRAIAVYQGLRQADLGPIQQALSQPEHEGFVIVGTIITALQHVLAQTGPFGDWSHPENIVFTMKFAAVFLSLFSVLNIGLVHRLSVQLGAGPPEAFFTAGMLALANSNFYFARHLLPYDAAISCCLLSLITAAKNPMLPRHALAAGCWCGAVFHVYNGYWFIVPVMCGLFFWGRVRQGRPAKSLAWYCAGAGFVLGLPPLLGWYLAGSRYFETMQAFGRSATFGLFAEGATFSWEYFAHAEGAFGLLVVIAIVAAIAVGLRQREPLPLRARVYGLLFLASYALLVLFSVGLEKIVIYARTTKPLAVFASCLGGWAIQRLCSVWPTSRIPLVIACAGLGLLNFAPHFSFFFPADAEIYVLKQYGNPKRSLSFSGSLYWPLGQAVTRPDLLLMNAQMIYPIRGVLSEPQGKQIFNVAHPLGYLPFQYECHSPRERALLRAQPLRITLWQLNDSATFPNDPPIALRYGNSDRPDGRH